MCGDWVCLFWQGYFWVANRPEAVWEWSTAGASRRFAPYGRWLPAPAKSGTSDTAADSDGRSGDAAAAAADAKSGSGTGAEAVATSGNAAATATADAKSGSGTAAHCSAGYGSGTGNVKNGEDAKTGEDVKHGKVRLQAEIGSEPGSAAGGRARGGAERMQRLVFIGIDMRRVGSLSALLSRVRCTFEGSGVSGVLQGIHERG